MSKTREDLLKLWQVRLKEIDQQSLTVREYCQRNSLTLHKYYYWRRKIRSLTQCQVEAKGECLTEIIFASEENKSSGLRVSFGNGIEIIPEKDFSECEFKRIVSLVRSL